MTQTSRIPVFVVNLEDDCARHDGMVSQFAALPMFAVQIIKAIDGRSFTRIMCAALAQNAVWSERRGTIGCFLSHVAAWEAVAKLADPYAIVLEDDVSIAGLAHCAALAIPDGAEIVFINDRMSPGRTAAVAAPAVLPLWHALQALDSVGTGGPGADGYLLTPQAARKMLAACEKESFFGHVDGRILRYATSEADLERLPAGSWIGNVIRHHHHGRLVPTLGLLRGYCLSQPLVTHGAVPSSREARDTGDLIPAPRRVTRAPASGTRPATPVQPGPPDTTPMVPIRYWHRVQNAGDLINPHIVEAVSGLRPYVAPDSASPHLLAVGSILFMANEHSHIWGAGMLDPASDYSRINMSNVHAVRGKLTERVLRSHYGLTGDVALGDPGVFADELPQIGHARRHQSLRRRAALVPHFAMVNHPDIQRLARACDAGIINPRLPCLDFLKELIASEIIISQSLHGLIFAEALGKPSVWIAHDPGDLWTFKFHDWFSNTQAPPRKPLGLGASGAAVLAEARLSGLALDREALRAAFPAALSADRVPGVSYRHTRMQSPKSVLVTSVQRQPASPDHDATLYCEPGNIEMLRRGLNAYAEQFDDLIPCWLVFEPDVFHNATRAAQRRAVELLTELPDIHFLGLIGPPFGNAPVQHAMGRLDDADLSVHGWSDACNWRGAVLVRSLPHFSFAAPGHAIVQTGGGIGGLPYASAIPPARACASRNDFASAAPSVSPCTPCK